MNRRAFIGGLSVSALLSSIPTSAMALDQQGNSRAVAERVWGDKKNNPDWWLRTTVWYYIQDRAAESMFQSYQMKPAQMVSNAGNSELSLILPLSQFPTPPIETEHVYEQSSSSRTLVRDDLVFGTLKDYRNGVFVVSRLGNVLMEFETLGSDSIATFNRSDDLIRSMMAKMKPFYDGVDVASLYELLPTESDADAVGLPFLISEGFQATG